MDIAHERLYRQRVAGTPFETSAEVVRWLGAVQAQDYFGAQWALGLRMRAASDAAIERALADGAILRTHVMRPTWHFLHPDDIRPLLALTAPRVHALNAYMYRKTELDADTLRRSSDVLVSALQGGKQLTRAEIAEALTLAGIETKGEQRLSYILMHAELNALIASGGRRGKQFTYALLDERVPAGKPFVRDKALAELTRRYFTSHGPALIEDFVGWSGLTKADARAGLALLGADVTQEVVGGLTYWRAAATPDSAAPPLPAYLLPPYDEYTIAYKDHRHIFDAAFAPYLTDEFFGGVIVIDGQGVGYWRRTLGKQAVTIRLTPFRPLSDTELDAVFAAAQRYGQFLGLPAVLE